MENRRLRRLVIVTAIVAVAALGLAAVVGVLWGPLPVRGQWRGGRAPGGAQSIDERESIDVAGLERLVIETTSEEIRVRTGEGPAVLLHFHGTFSAADPEARPRLVVSREGARATGRVERRSLAAVGWQMGELALEVEVPRAYAGELSVRSVSGEIAAGDLSLVRVDLASTSGDLTAGRIRSEALSLFTVSGEVSVEAAQAATTEFSSASGTVRIAGLTGALRGQTVSGDQDLVFAAAPQQVQLQSTSGEVSLRLPAASAFRLEARSTSGDVTCRLPIQLDEYASGAGRNSLAGTVGGGGGVIGVRTVSGDIRIQE